jgi:hypothetical protein
MAIHHSNLKVMSRVDKTKIKPLPRPIRDALSLEYHLQLEALRAGAGTLMGLRILVRVAMAAELLYEHGYGQKPAHRFIEYERIASDAFAVGRDGGYLFNLFAFRTFAALVTKHDAQLESTPVAVIDIVARRLQRCTVAA